MREVPDMAVERTSLAFQLAVLVVVTDFNPQGGRGGRQERATRLSISSLMFALIISQFSSAQSLQVFAY